MSLILLIATMPLSTGESSTYESQWNGETFTEYTDPLERFQSFPVEDTDGDGFADIEPLPYVEEVAMPPGSMDSVTNLDIESQMALFGIGRNDIAAAIDTMLSWNSSADDVRAEAKNLVMQGLYKEGGGALTGTVLDITLFCGRDKAVVQTEWVIGIPALITCDGDVWEEVAILAMPTFVEVNAGALDVLHLNVRTQSLDPAHTGLTAWGIKYRPTNAAPDETHAGGVIANLQKPLEAIVELSGMTTKTIEAYTEMEFGIGQQFEANDRVLYTYGTTPTWDKTAYLKMKGNAGVMWVRATVTASDDYFSAVIEHSQPSGFDLIEASLDLGDGRRTQFTADNTPSKIGLAVRTTSGPSGDTTDVTINRPDGHWFRHDVEFKGTYYEWESGIGVTQDFSFQVRGFPVSGNLRVRPGNDDAPEDERVFSIDMTKVSVAGHFRTIIFDGYQDDKRLQLTASEVYRMRLVAGKKDQFKGDGDAFVLLGAVWPSLGNSFVHVDSDIPSSPDYKGELDHRDEDTLKWNLGEITLCVQSCYGNLHWGNSFLREPLLPFNAYFWAIGHNQLAQDECRLRYEALDNSCA